MTRKDLGFKRFGLFGSISKAVSNVTDVPNLSIVTKQANLGIAKVGVIILMRTTGLFPRTSVTLAGRLIGFTEFFCKTRRVSNAERTGLGWENGKFGTEYTIGATRYVGKVAVTREKRFTVPTVATVITGLRRFLGK
jgi:hypothetical protein